jgi:TolB protein
MPLAGETSQPQSVSEVVAADLARTGLFRLVNTVGVSPLPTEPSEVNFADWTTRTAEALVIGKIEPQSEGRVEVRFRLFDVAKQSQLASYSYVVAPRSCAPRRTGSPTSSTSGSRATRACSPPRSRTW